MLNTKEQLEIDIMNLEAEKLIYQSKIARIGLQESIVFFNVLNNELKKIHETNHNEC